MYNFLLLSFIGLLAGVFVFKRVWLGALLGIIMLVFSHWFQHEESGRLIINFGNAIIIWVQLAVLIFGAYFFYHALEIRAESDELLKIRSRVTTMLLLAFFLGGFLEGIAGFGIPALVVAPLMLHSGFRPLSSIVLPLGANAFTVIFGALGTPIKLGLGINQPNETTQFLLLLNILPAFVVPFVLTFLLATIEKIPISYKTEGLKIFGAGLCFFLPLALMAQYSVELPSVAGGGIGFFLFSIVFVPKNEMKALFDWIRNLLPYLLFIGLLLVAKFFLVNKSFEFSPQLRSFPYYQPGLVFVFAGAIFIFFRKKSGFFSVFLGYLGNSASKLRFTLLSLFALLFYTQLVAPHLPPLAKSLSNFPIYLNLVIQPFTGIAGSFITGSATMSNLLFAESISGYPASFGGLMTALIHSGSMAGNAISLQNILMVKSIVTEPVSDGLILKYNIGLVLVLWVCIVVAGLGIYVAN